MHNNIMAVSSRDHPPMLAMGRYAQWQSCFLRYINTRPNGDSLRKCILEGPYQPTTVTIPALPATDDSPAVPEQTAVKTILTMLKQGESLNIKMSRLICLPLNLLSEEYYLQYQKEVNEIHAERIARNANPLALVDAASPYPDPYYQAPKSHKPYAPTSKQSSSTRSNASTNFKGKEIAKLITPPSESAFKEDSDPEHAQRDRDIYKNDNQTGQFRNQRTMTVAGAREAIGSQSFMAMIQEVPTADSGTDTEPLEQVQNDAEYNLFANIQKQLKKANASLAHELKEYKSILVETSRTLRESNSIQDSCLVVLQNKQTEFERYKSLNVTPPKMRVAAEYCCNAPLRKEDVKS
nr:hypothetical protein [Tanacetum cinerariifolium]